MCQREGDEEEKAEKQIIWTELSVCLCLRVSPLDGRVKGHEEEEEEMKRTACLDEILCVMSLCGP